MDQNKIKILFIVFFSAFLLNIFLLASTGSGQGGGGEEGRTQAGSGSTIQITRTPFLSFERIPDSFGFPSASASSLVQQVYSNSYQTTLSPERALIVSDTRNSGGFNLQLSSSGNLLPVGGGGTPNIPASGLRVISSTEINPIPADPPPTINDGIIYLTGFSGDQNIVAPVDVAFNETEGCNSFGDLATFINDNCRTVTPASNNMLDNPVDLMQGCLASSAGRSGLIQIGLAYNLAIPRYTPPNTYYTTLTFTLSDATDNC